MTTIAWDGMTVASDSQSTEGEIRGLHPCKKLIKYKGNIYAFAGTISSCKEVIRWLKRGGKKTDVPEMADMDFAVLQFKDGKCFLYCADFSPSQILPPYTMGTGKEVALGAILAGVTAQEAVRITCDVDINSGLPVQHYEVSDA